MENNSEIKIDRDNPEFGAVLDLIEQTNQSIFLTGKAGTGKTTLLKYITETTRKKHVVLAPTGIAAVGAGGQTLHSFFRIPFKPMLPDDPDYSPGRLRKRLRYPKEHIRLIKNVELIIIDEISMVRADIIDFIDKVLRIYSGNMRIPFGGKQMLFVGDMFQLEPVVTADDRDVLAHAYPTSAYYFFNALVFKNFNLIPIELTKVYRQSDPGFLNLLNNVRVGAPSSADIDTLNRRVDPDFEMESGSKDFTMTIATRRDMVDAINDHHLNRLATPSITYKGTITDDFPASSLPTDLNLELKVGAQVVFIKNDSEKRWVNGTLAVVETCLPDQVTVRTEDGTLHAVQPERWVNVKYVYNEEKRTVDEIELGSFTQYPLKQAWAITIHKSQGLTFNNVIIDIGRGAFAGGQTYVALSRCRSLDGITLTNPIRGRDIYVKNDVVQFARQFNDKELINSAIERGRADSLFRSASRLFDSGQYALAIADYNEAVALNPSVLTHENVKRLLARKTRKLTQLHDQIDALQQKLSENDTRFAKIAQAYVDAADELSGEGWEADAAVAQYDKALSISPDYGPAILGKASIYLKLGRYDDASSLYKTYIDKCDEPWRGHLGLGNIALAQGDHFGALSSYLYVHENYPKLEQPVRLIIDVYEELDDPANVRHYKALLTKIRSKKPKSPRK